MRTHVSAKLAGRGTPVVGGTTAAADAAADPAVEAATTELATTLLRPPTGEPAAARARGAAGGTKGGSRRSAIGLPTSRCCCSPCASAPVALLAAAPAHQNELGDGCVRGNVRRRRTVGLCQARGQQARRRAARVRRRLGPQCALADAQRPGAAESRACGTGGCDRQPPARARRRRRRCKLQRGAAPCVRQPSAAVRRVTQCMQESDAVPIQQSTAQRSHAVQRPSAMHHRLRLAAAAR